MFTAHCEREHSVQLSRANWTRGMFNKTRKFSEKNSKLCCYIHVHVVTIFMDVLLILLILFYQFRINLLVWQKILLSILISMFFILPISIPSFGRSRLTLKFLYFRVQFDLHLGVFGSLQVNPDGIETAKLNAADGTVTVLRQRKKTKTFQLWSS